MSSIKVVPLGAGQDVGRSCVLVTIGGKNIMFDCGMHMGFQDQRRFPDFDYITATGNFTDVLDCIIISHFHLDHCGALPFFTEMRGYDGPIYMTHPTKAICPILLEDYRKVQVDRKGETNFFTSDHIKNCMKKVVPLNLLESHHVDDELEIRPYYAGHVLGAAMFHVRVGTESVVYTGDYNMTPDRHLGAAWIDRCRPDLLITESTYATTVRDSKRCREMDFLQKVHEVVERGGKVLIPVFALGRAQELCILLETYWERMNLRVPIFFSAGLVEKANHYYRLFISWTNEKIRKTFVQRNMFEFKCIQPFDRAYINEPGPMVLFSTPGMLHAGQSLQVFTSWCSSPDNMVILPGYCVAGTVGHKVLSGAKKIDISRDKSVDVRLSVQHLSFSAHADAKGIMQLIRMCQPKNVMLVHGEKKKMSFLRDKIVGEYGCPCFFPANGQSVEIDVPVDVPVDVSLRLLQQQRKRAAEEMVDDARERAAVDGLAGGFGGGGGGRGGSGVKSRDGDDVDADGDRYAEDTAADDAADGGEEAGGGRARAGRLTAGAWAGFHGNPVPAATMRARQRAASKRPRSVFDVEDDEVDDDDDSDALAAVRGPGAKGASAAAAAARPAWERKLLDGVLVMERGKPIRMLEAKEAAASLGLRRHALSFATMVPLVRPAGMSEPVARARVLDEVHTVLAGWLGSSGGAFGGGRITRSDDAAGAVVLRSVNVSVKASGVLSVAWSYADDDLGERVRALLINKLSCVRRPGHVGGGVD